MVESVADLRARVLQQHKNAGRKVSRLERSGASVSGTEFDPRRDVSKVRGYTRKQLLAYQRELQEFSRRGGGFVPIGDGRVTVREWDRFKAAEREVNRIRSDVFNRVKDVEVEGLNQTFGKVIGIEPTRVRDADSTNNPFRNTNTPSDAFPGVDEFRNRQVNMFDLADVDTYVSRFNDSMRSSLTKMFDMIAGVFGEGVLDGMDSQVAEMSELGFMMLASRKSFMNKAADVYEVATMILGGNKSKREELNDNRLEMTSETSENIDSMKETIDAVQESNDSLKGKLQRLQKKYQKRGGMFNRIVDALRGKGE